MLNKYTWLLFLGISQWCFIANAQDTTNFFPHRVGDFWEYYFTDFIGDDTIQVEVISDSLGQNGFHYITHAARSINPIGPPEPFSFDTTKYILDTTNQVLKHYSFGTGALVNYKLDASEGDQWVIWGDENDAFEMARLSSVFQDTIFNTPTILKVYNFYFTNDSTDTSGLDSHYDILSDKFGLVYRYVAEGGWYFILKGAIIDNVTFGDTTLVGIELLMSGVIPDQAILQQNYPNPFNPQTTIPIYLKRPVKLSLIIYDAIGRPVAKLADNKWFSAGNHNMEWNGKTMKGGDAASGIYYYQLMVGQQSYSRRMLLLH